MKLSKIYKYLLCAIFIFVLSGFTCLAEDVPNPASDFTYTAFEEGVIIIGYVGKSTTVVIPEFIEDLPVTEIGEEAFRNNLIIKKIVIPGSVQAIRSGAFAECESLKEAVIDLAPIASIDGKYAGIPAFYGCSALTTVSIGSGIRLYIGDNAFGNCTSLKTVTLPRSVRNQDWRDDNWPFGGCTSLKTINYRGSVSDYLFTNVMEGEISLEKHYAEALENGLVVNYNYIGD